MNNPFRYTPSPECDAAFGRLCAHIDELRQSGNERAANLCRELDAGKMLGVLLASDCEGEIHTLFAFSGQLGDGGFKFPGFVGAVFDYLEPDGYFKTEEAAISQLSRKIATHASGPLAKARADYDRVSRELEAEVEAMKEKCRKAKIDRDIIRNAGAIDAEQQLLLIRQSQFEKAELSRMKKRMAAALAPYSELVKKEESAAASMKQKRREDSERLQRRLFSDFRLLNARGESRNLLEIFAHTPLSIPPSGAGECCAPKLLQEAYLRGWHPQSIAEYWYGSPKDGEVRRHGEHYPACRGKCGPVLAWMLQGLETTPPLDSEADAGGHPAPEIMFENEWFCVVSKPSGMLSVPGKGKAQSVQHWLEERYGGEREVKLAHRLDQDTSGLLIATFGESAYKTMQMLFATRKVKKQYAAILEGDYIALGKPKSGAIELPLSSDWFDRPRQRVDFEDGKPAATLYEFSSSRDGKSRVTFYPTTGRTHQLRIHAASTHGLSMPIAGDRLYGHSDASPRLMLHAEKIEFTFPINGRHYSFELPAPYDS